MPTSSLGTAPDTAVALFDDNQALDYGGLRARITALLPVFRAAKRGLVFCCLANSVDSAVAYLTVATTGHALAVIDPALSHLMDIVTAYQPDWIIAPHSSDFRGYVQEAWELRALNLWRKKEPCFADLHPEFYLMLLTSGSTGSSKSVRLSYRNLASNTSSIVESLNLNNKMRAFLHLPLFYSFGLSVLHGQLMAGGSCILTSHSMTSREFWDLAKTRQATMLPGVPYHYEMLARLGLARLDVPHMKTFLQAGGGMKKELTDIILQQVQERQGELYIMYGQTEAGPRISSFPLHLYPQKIGSCGQVLTGGKLATEDDEVIYEGPNVMMGYAEIRADLAQGDVMKGRLATGDLGRIDKEGFLTISGRKQRFAKLFGQRIALDDLEKLVDSIAAATALELPDRIVLVTMESDTTICERVKTQVIGKTGLPAGWIEVRSVKNIPHKSSGKIDYQALREML